MGSRASRRNVIAISFLCGAVPFSQVAARAVAGVDLRHHGSGTVSGTGLYEVAGFAPLAVAGCLEVAKGAVGPLLAGPSRPVLAACAAGATVAGHDWSPALGGKGGRGISPSLGAMLVLAPEGSAVLVSGLALGRLTHQTALGSLLASAALVPILSRRRGTAGLLLALAVTVPMMAKRLLGNDALTASPLNRRWRRRPEARRILLNRVLFDRDGSNEEPAE